MPPLGIMHLYTLGWLSCCIVAGLLVLRHRESFGFLHRDYWRLQSEPWKLATGVTASIGMAVIAPYTGDPTWDYVDALFMSILTYATAPWVVAMLYRAGRRMASSQQLFVAGCMWLFTASWSYDLYIWIRDGYYPLTWGSNLVASSFLYLMGGIVWSLEWRPDRGMSFSFIRTDWPQHSVPTPFRRIAWLALPIMLLVAILLIRFLFP
ncbi:MAG: hypothetical protein PHD54_15090 [Desulfuromonadaceae bacterium]|nr:hypothetical protein [Desulfuromonadaceae bacterium]